MPNKKTKLKTEQKWSVSLSGASVPTYLQELAKKKNVSNAQIVNGLQDYLQENPKFAKEFMDYSATISTSRKVQATDSILAKKLTEVAILIKKSKKPKQNISFLRNKIKEEAGEKLPY
jgi:hypothetical protein